MSDLIERKLVIEKIVEWGQKNNRADDALELIKMMTGVPSGNDNNWVGIRENSPITYPLTNPREFRYGPDCTVESNLK